MLLSRVLGRLDRAVAPDLLRLEIAHVLRKKTHSGLDIAEALEAWKDLNVVPIEWVPVQPLLDTVLIEALPGRSAFTT